MPYCVCCEVASRVVAYLQMEVCAPLAAARTIKTPPPRPINRRCMRYRPSHTAMRHKDPRHPFMPVY